MAAVPKSVDGAVDNVSVSILVVHGDYTIRYANPAAHRMLGYRQGTLAGLSLAHLVPQHRHAELNNVSSVLMRRRACKFRSQVTRADGRAVDVQLTIEPAAHDVGHGPAVTVSLNPVPPWGARASVDSEEITLRHSGVREAEPDMSDEHLATALDLLSWLEQRLAAPAEIGSLDDPRERARAQHVLSEVRELVSNVRRRDD